MAPTLVHGVKNVIVGGGWYNENDSPHLAYHIHAYTTQHMHAGGQWAAM